MRSLLGYAFILLGTCGLPGWAAERQSAQGSSSAQPGKTKAESKRSPEVGAAANSKPKSKDEPKAESRTEEPLYYSILALGKNIPDPGYLRVRNIIRIADGSQQIDAEGKADDSGYTFTQVANVLSVEGALSEKVAFLVAVPYVLSNTLSLDQRKFQTSKRFKAEQLQFAERILKEFAKGLQNAGQCETADSCERLARSTINSGATLPASTITLASGEQVALPAATAAQLSSLRDTFITNAATPSQGATGLGDIDVGGSYTFAQTGRQFFNVGLGFRLPTGRFEKVPNAQVQTGEGMLQFGVRVSYDWLVIRPLMLSLQDQMVGMLVPGHRKKSSLLNPNALNTSDPTTADAVEAGSDGNGNTQRVIRQGLSHDLIFRANLGLAFLSRKLQPFDVEASYNRKIGADVYYDGTLKYPGENINSVTYGFKMDGLGFDRPVPMYFRFAKEKFLDGENVLIASDYTYIELSLYQSF